MELGLLPALGGGIRELQSSGQDSRLIDGYLSAYAAAFDRVWYFSYLSESLGDYTDDARLLSSVTLLAPRRSQPRLARALALPLAHRAALRRCGVVRVFQVTGVIPALVARALWGIPYVTTYGFWYARLSRPGPSRPAKRLLERVGLRLAAGVIVPTEALRAHVASLTSPARVYLIPNGVDTARFTPGEGRPGPARKILYVGRLEPEKNLPTLVMAAAKLAARFPLRLTLIGAGSLLPELRAQAEALGVVAEFPGVVDHRRLPERYREADAFVLPSFTEGHPKVLLEAMASGLPCVASDCAGNRALVRDGESGLLFDARSPDALAAALERVLGEVSFALALGRRAREAVAGEYDLGILVAREIQLLKQVAGAGRR
ncbi:MAG: glycosyltransferase [Candidatus Rokubacteria bacterium]|nr:glycosyltransferase [Candidatus Rokubacteria bacterium]